MVMVFEKEFTESINIAKDYSLVVCFSVISGEVLYLIF